MSPETSPMSFKIETPDGASHVLSVEPVGKLWFGRDPSCAVVLDAPMVSRKHFALEVQKDGFWLTDQSNNGTLVDDEVVLRQRKLIATNAKLRVGPYLISLQAEKTVVVPVPAPEVKPEGRPVLALVPREKADSRPATAREVSVARRRLMHRRLLDSLDLDRLDRRNTNMLDMRPQVLAALRRISAEMAEELPRGAELEQLLKELCDESLGLGPLEDLIANPDVSEIMVVDPQTIFAEIRGRIQHTPYRFTDSESVRSAIERIVTPLGRRIDESTPLVDARLHDGSRVNAVIPPLAIKGPCITIRKFARERLTVDRLVSYGSMTERMARFLNRAVRIRKNLVISGGTGSGKTTLLNVLSAAIPDDERVVTIEDAAELQLSQTHVVSLESRPANMEGKGAYTIRDLVKNALRMRPDRIIVGECRGGEAIDMLQAMNTGHDGSMTTTHANSPREAVARLETLCLMSGLDLPVRAIRSQIASSVNLIVQQSRYSDGSRRISSISEITEINEDGEIEVFEIFGFHRTGTGPKGEILGEFRASGYVPTFIDQFIAAGLITDGDYL